MTTKQANGDENHTLPLSPKRRMDDDGLDLDAALNPAKLYPRKRVAVAVSLLMLWLMEWMTDLTCVV
jgi:hypothetical protein